MAECAGSRLILGGEVLSNNLWRVRFVFVHMLSHIVCMHVMHSHVTYKCVGTVTRVSFRHAR